MYSSKKDKFNTDLLKAELAKAKELGQAIKVDELTACDQANIKFVNQYKDAVEVVAFRDQMKRICELAGINCVSSLHFSVFIMIALSFDPCGTDCLLPFDGFSLELPFNLFGGIPLPQFIQYVAS